MAREQDVRRLLAATRRVRPGRRRTTTLPEAQRVARAASLVLSRMPTDPRCLVRSLVVIELLARRGIEARLVIATTGANEFTAHAWVELAGQALLPTAGFTSGRLAEL